LASFHFRQEQYIRTQLWGLGPEEDGAWDKIDPEYDIYGDDPKRVDIATAWADRIEHIGKQAAQPRYLMWRSCHLPHM